MAEAGVWAIALAVLGAIAGSFLATIAVRWPQERSVRRGRSACDGCGRTLSPCDLVPLVSWMAAHGRCRACGALIDARHPAIEAGCAAIGLASALAAPGLAGVAGAVFGWLLLTLAVMDARDFWLPDALVLALAVAGGLASLVVPPEPAERLIGGGAGFALLWLVAAGYRAWRGVDGMGGGDPKLFGAIGLWLGWRMLPSVLLVAGLIGLGWTLWRRVRGDAVSRDDMLPLGTLMVIAAYPAWLVMIGPAV